jgi:hypothetical protein
MPHMTAFARNQWFSSVLSVGGCIPGAWTPWVSPRAGARSRSGPSLRPHLGSAAPVVDGRDSM